MEKFGQTKVGEMDIKQIKYFVKTETVETKPGCWSCLKVNIFEQYPGKEPLPIGSYVRGYHDLFDTFYPFMQDGKWYALYSDDYTTTRVMELPSCQRIAGEEGNSWGFCPTGYYVPQEDTEDDWYEEDPTILGKFGFICGCTWGDDSSWKIQCLDLSKIKEGIFKRDNRFGYLELLGDYDRLKDSIEIDDYDKEDYREDR